MRRPHLRPRFVIRAAGLLAALAIAACAPSEDIQTPAGPGDAASPATNTLREEPAVMQNAEDTLKPEYLRCDYRVNPLGIDERRPRLSWALACPRRGARQTAYQILAAASPDLLAADHGDLWDTGKVVSPETIQIIWNGSVLNSRDRCWWKVRVWDENDQPSSWSPAASWTMGPLKPEDWQAKWIGFDESLQTDDDRFDLDGAQWIWHDEPGMNPQQKVPEGKRWFRARVTLPAGVESAEAVISVDNQFVLYINGRKAAESDGEGDAWRRPVQADLAEFLQPGENVLAMEALNEGESPAGVVAKIVVKTGDGRKTILATGEGILSTDAHAEGWETPGHDDSAWRPARVLDDYPTEPWGTLSAGKLVLPPPRYLRRCFTLDRPIRRATVYASALGLYQLHLNGLPVGEDYFTPGWTDYETRVYYQAYDVTERLQTGENALGAILADGWYAGYVGFGTTRELYGGKTRLLAQVEVEYDNGAVETLVATDEGWRAAGEGPLREADFLMGEVYDATAEIPGWSAPDFDDDAWKAVDVGDAPVQPAIEAHPGVPVRRLAEIKPVSLTEPEPGNYVYDLGQNFAGFVRLSIQTPRGTEITLRFAERLNPDGTVYTTNLRGARATDRYVCRGGGETETWEPRFTFHGFQYVELTGCPEPPTIDTITGVPLSSATPKAGSFSCSDDVANQLYSNICWTQAANFIEVPTDCPQRDERLGWTGDAQVYVGTATWNADVAAFFRKWLTDLNDAQSPDGAYPDVAPRKVAMGGGTAAWADAGIICPWVIYETYRDRRNLLLHYDSMARFIDYCRETATDLIRPDQGYGDWLNIDDDTPRSVIGTAYFAYSTLLMSRIADVLKKTEDARKYRALYEDIRRRFNEEFVSEDGHIHGDTQTGCVLALRFELVQGDLRRKTADRLVELIEARDRRLSTGFVGTKDLMQVLSAIGRTDLAYALFHNDTFPSWGFTIKHGATSIWERWDGWTPDKGFQNPGMNSFAHYSFGAVGEWMFETIGGISPVEPGFGRVRIAPEPGGNLTWAKVSHQSIRGAITSDWTLTDDGLELRVAVPPNVTATVSIPAASSENVWEGAVRADEAEGVRLIGQIGDRVEYEVGGGDYSFVVKR